jgi:hypothetical protein
VLALWGIRLLKLMILRQVVCDGEPCCLRADKDVSRRSNGWLVNERSKRDMHELAFANDRVKQRAALVAMDVVSWLASVDEHVIRASNDRQLASLYAREGLECGTGCAPAI